MFDLSGNYLELNYFVYGNSTQVTYSARIRIFRGLFNIFTVDGMGHPAINLMMFERG